MTQLCLLPASRLIVFPSFIPRQSLLSGVLKERVSASAAVKATVRDMRQFREERDGLAIVLMGRWLSCLHCGGWWRLRMDVHAKVECDKIPWLAPPLLVIGLALSPFLHYSTSLLHEEFKTPSNVSAKIIEGFSQAS